MGHTPARAEENRSVVGGLEAAREGWAVQGSFPSVRMTPREMITSMITSAIAAATENTRH